MFAFNMITHRCAMGVVHGQVYCGCCHNGASRSCSFGIRGNAHECCWECMLLLLWVVVTAVWWWCCPLSTPNVCFPKQLLMFLWISVIAVMIVMAQAVPSN